MFKATYNNGITEESKEFNFPHHAAHWILDHLEDSDELLSDDAFWFGVSTLDGDSVEVWGEVVETDDQPTQDEINNYLTALRDSGICNMYEGPSRIMLEFELTRQESFDMFEVWCNSF